MSSKQFKSQASSSRAASGAFGAAPGAFGNSPFGSSPALGTVSVSPLSYVYEPPDLAGISEPNVVVALKNLQKKDGTTKTKALEDLQTYVSSQAVAGGGIEDPLLEAWIKLYPRTSIDNSRRVRQLAHVLHGAISSSSGKRFARHMPKSIGAWLAGLHDNDRIVSRAAQNAFQTVFPSEDKRRIVWRVYQQPILEYCRDAVLKENVQTLSDERTASPDDAKAKYARVIGAAILTVSSALDTLTADDLRNQREIYRDFFQTENILKLAGHSDSFVRKAVYQLVLCGIAKQELVDSDMTAISMCLVQEGLHIDQTGSVYDYVKMLAQLTKVYPGVWTEYYTGLGKRSALKSLCRFLRKGLQGGPSDFWHQITVVIERMPIEVLRPKPKPEGDSVLQGDGYPSTTVVLAAIREGINRKGEHRSNDSEGWRTYFNLIHLAIQSESDPDQLRAILEVSVIPILEQFINPSAEGLGWTISTSDQYTICGEAAKVVLDRAPDLFEQTWRRSSILLVQELQMSLPEQSKDHAKSQDAVTLTAKRWYSLQAFIFKEKSLEQVRSVLVETARSEIKSMIEILGIRSGKPYGAAAALDLATSLVPESTIRQSDVREAILTFAKSDLPKLLLSPSSPYLINLLNTLRDEDGIEDIYQMSIKALAGAPDSATKFQTLQGLVSSPWIGREGTSDDMLLVVRKSLHEALGGNEERWLLVTAAIGNRSTPIKVSDDILSRMVESLSIEGTEAGALRGLDLVVTQDEAAFKQYSSSPKGATLLSRLLFLTESPNQELSKEARKLSNSIRKVLSRDKGPGEAQNIMVEIIQKGIKTADPKSLSVASLVSEATQIFCQASGDERHRVAEVVLPSASSWAAALDPFLYRHPDTSLALTNPLGGAINLIEQSTDRKGSHISRDTSGNSSALRMAWFVTEICTLSNIFDFTTAEQRSSTCRSLAIFVMLATDSLGVPQQDGLWLGSDPAREMEAANLVAQAQLMLASWIINRPMSEKGFVQSAQSDLLASSRGISSMAYYSARAYVAITSELENVRPSSSVTSDEVCLHAARDVSNPIYAAAYLAGVSGLSLALRLCNMLVAELTGLKVGDFPVDGLRQLVLLNISIRRLEDHTQIPQPRLVFFVRHMLSQLRDNKAAVEVATEIHKALTVILPLVKEVYESFWQKIIDVIVDGWATAASGNTSDIPSLHASLKLCATLQALLTDEESNDDLKDSWQAKRSTLVDLLVKVMKLRAGKVPQRSSTKFANAVFLDVPDDVHQPRRMVNELLQRQITMLSSGLKHSAKELYPVLASEVPSLQLAAFQILHEQIPKNQEEASIEAALSSSFNASLPEELLSLILTAPSYEISTGNLPDGILSLPLTGYLLSWILILDHWTNASYKLQNDYATKIKDGTYLKNFLDLAFEFLIDCRVKPVDASQFNIDAYKPGIEDILEKDAQWLIIHIYYLCCKYLPTLSRAWWRDDCPRHLQKPIEAWTEKYISPTVIKHELLTVATWLPTQPTTPTTPTDPPLAVKISHRAHELTASHPIDDTEIAIRISLPASYPLSPTTVTTIHRVGIDEKKWRAWLLTTAGVINFSSTGGSGGLVEGLVAWRKNVTGALRGQSECAICYSVVSAERGLPNKRCGTCKNLFHGSCLYKWFRSSSSSSCPLCRNAFNYG